MIAMRQIFVEGKIAVPAVQAQAVKSNQGAAFGTQQNVFGVGSAPVPAPAPNVFAAPAFTTPGSLF